ncbi:MAG: DEAD/DEAH box helicase family protein, partial [Pseudomonadota bacterium]
MTASPALFPEDAPAPKLRVKVLLPLPMGDGYDYAVEGETAPPPGSFVKVPLGPREVIGVVWSVTPDASVPDKKLKSVLEVIDTPPLHEDVIAFVDWVAQYTISPRGAVLRLVMRSGQALAPVKPLLHYTKAAIPEGMRLTAAREAVLAAASDEPLSVADLARAAGVSDAVVRGLVKAGALMPVEVDPDPPFPAPDPGRPGRPLSPDQQDAVDELSAQIRQDGYSTTLLDGVTGSGKTEVYLEAIATALAADPTAQVCVLLPEIALTLPFLKRIEER